MPVRRSISCLTVSPRALDNRERLADNSRATLRITGCARPTHTLTVWGGIESTTAGLGLNQSRLSFWGYAVSCFHFQAARFPSIVLCKNVLSFPGYRTT